MSILLRDYVYDAIRDVSIAADVVAGTVGVVNDSYGFWPYAVDVSVDRTSIFVTWAKQALATKKTGTGQAINEGDFVYGDPADSYAVSATKGAGYLYLGKAIQAASASDTTVLIEFDGLKTTLY